MDNSTFFGHLSSTRIAEIIDNAKGSICFAAPGIHLGPAKAMVRGVDLERLESGQITM